MLKLKPITLDEFIRVHWTLAVCGECHAQQIAKTDDEREAKKEFHEAGWRQYETDYEVGGMTCPNCIAIIEKGTVN